MDDSDDPFSHPEDEDEDEDAIPPDMPNLPNRGVNGTI